MRIIFAGTPAFAAVSLAALLESEHEIVAVYTQPDRPAGRGRKLTASPVKQLAQAHKIAVEQPLNFKNAADRQQLADYQADIMVVVAYGLILPQAILDTPRFGCLNIHASLLPRWRGAAPIQRAILAGDKQTGVCIMQMAAGLDTGPVLHQLSLPILSSDTAESLHDKLADLGAEALVTTLDNLSEKQANAQPQDDTLSSYAEKLHKSEAVIDWQQSAIQIDRQIRAFNPWPVAQTIWQQVPLRIWAAGICPENFSGKPGEIVRLNKQQLCVATSDGALQLNQLQLPGKKAMPVADLLNAKTFQEGDRFA